MCRDRKGDNQMKRKSTWNRRVLAVILAVLMVCSALQSPALANSGRQKELTAAAQSDHAEPEGAVQETGTDAGAQSGSEKSGAADVDQSKTETAETTAAEPDASEAQNAETEPGAAVQAAESGQAVV